MVNFGLNSASILGIALAVAGAGLYFLRSVRPEVSRDYDIFFSAVGLLCGLILLFQGWRLDPILQFGQLLLAGSTVFFAVETVRLRGITTEQARRNTPYADDRRVSKTRVYTEAELDRLEAYEDEEETAPKRRLRGYDDPRSERPPSRSETETRAPRPRRSSRPSSAESERPPSTRSRRPPAPRQDDDRWREESADVWEEQPQRTRRSNRPPAVEPEETAEAPRRAPRRRPSTASAPTRKPNPYEDEPPAAYVDYQPLEDADAPEEDTPPDEGA
jgi:hypothetical protein